MELPALIDRKKNFRMNEEPGKTKDFSRKLDVCLCVKPNA